MPADKFDVVVVGAGLVGAWCALALAQQSSLRIAVVERAAPLTGTEPANQRVVALGPLATDLLSNTGTFEQLDQHSAFPYQRMHIWDAGSDGELLFDAADYSRPTLGHMVDALRCNWQLQEQLRASSQVSVFYGFEAKELTQNAQHARLRGMQQEIIGELIIAADGAGSWVRQQAKIFSSRLAFEQTAIVCQVATQAPHQDTAWQRFLATGPVAFLPLAENLSSVVWSVDSGLADELMGAPDTEFENQLTDAFAHRLGAVTLQNNRRAFSLHSQQAERYFSERVVLLGDAAHSIHPLAGQGANLGFKDASRLTTLLCAQPTTLLNDARMLGRYQRQRKTDNQQTDWLMRSLNRAYASEMAWWQLARGKGMNWLSSEARVKGLLARHAMGLEAHQ